MHAAALVPLGLAGAESRPRQRIVDLFTGEFNGQL
jgi:hypothetical protein